MKPEPGFNSPAQLASLSIMGSLIASCAFVILLPARTHPYRSVILLDFVICCALLLVAACVCCTTNSILRDGIRNERWKLEDIDKLRAVLLSPWFRAIAIALILVFLIFNWDWPRPHSPYKLAAWAIYIPALNLNWLINAVRRERNANPKPTWSDLPPLHSEHWGQQ